MDEMNGAMNGMTGATAGMGATAVPGAHHPFHAVPDASHHSHAGVQPLPPQADAMGIGHPPGRVAPYGHGPYDHAPHAHPFGPLGTPAHAPHHPSGLAAPHGAYGASDRHTRAASGNGLAASLTSSLGSIGAALAGGAGRGLPVLRAGSHAAWRTLALVGRASGAALGMAGAHLASNPGGIARRGVPALVALLVLRAAFGQDAPHDAPWFERADAAPVAAVVDEGATRADPVVFGLQSELADLGYYTGAIDGVAGSRTRAAVEAYERDAGLPVTGRAGPTILARIRAGASDIAAPRAARIGGDAPGLPASSPAPLPSPLPRPAPSRTATLDAVPDPVSTGSVEPAIASGGDELDASDPVVLAQRGLAAWGQDLAVDGMMGPRTRGAVEAYESANGLPVTGAPKAVIAHMRAAGLL